MKTYLLLGCACLSRGMQGLKARGWWMSQQMQCYLLLAQPQALGASQHHVCGKNPAPGVQCEQNGVCIKKRGLSYTSGLSTRAKYFKGREEALWATSALIKMTCVLASEDTHGDTGKSSIIFHTTSPPSRCLCAKNSPGCFVDVLYIAQTLSASTYMDTYCVAKKNSRRLLILEAQSSHKKSMKSFPSYVSR